MNNGNNGNFLESIILIKYESNGGGCRLSRIIPSSSGRPNSKRLKGILGAAKLAMLFSHLCSKCLQAFLSVLLSLCRISPVFSSIPLFFSTVHPSTEAAVIRFLRAVNTGLFLILLSILISRFGR